MKTELRLTVAAIAAALPLLSAGAAQTINFGPPPLGPVTGSDGVIADGYAGFDWHGAQNDVFADDSSPFGFGSAFITEMSRTSAFDLDSMVMQTLNDDAPDHGDVTSLETVISGFYNGNLVKTVTADYAWGGGNVLSVNMDGVNDIKFTTTAIRTMEGVSGVTTGPDLTLVTQMTVDNFTGTAKAPELDPTATASAVTLLLGSLLVIRGRRVKGRAT